MEAEIDLRRRIVAVAGVGLVASTHSVVAVLPAAVPGVDRLFDVTEKNAWVQRLRTLSLP